MKGSGGRFCFSILDVSAWETDGTGSSYPRNLCSTDFTMVLELVKRRGEETSKRTSNYRARLKLTYYM